MWLKLKSNWKKLKYKISKKIKLNGKYIKFGWKIINIAETIIYLKKFHKLKLIFI